MRIESGAARRCGVVLYVPRMPVDTKRQCKAPTTPPAAAPPSEFKPLLTVEAVAALLDTTPGQINNARSRGQIPADCAVIVPGFGLRFKASRLHAWLRTIADEPGEEVTP